MAIQPNTTYLNRTPNKTARGTRTFKPEFVVMHETAGYGSLEWNLRADVRSSYNYLITRGGTIYHYVDERRYVAWHAGKFSRHTFPGGIYAGDQINRWAIGVEIEGPNNGDPITPAQKRAAVELMLHFRTAYGIPLDARYYPAHKDVAPYDAEGDVYKTDPRGYAVADLLALAAPPPADAIVIGVAPSISLVQYRAALARNQAPLSGIEVERTYLMCLWLEIDPAFVLALWVHESGRPLGSSGLQQQTRCPINMKATPGERRPTVEHNGAIWRAYESFQLGMLASIEHLKTVYGWQHKAHTVRAIIPIFAPASDGNDTERYIASVLEDMAYMRGQP